MKCRFCNNSLTNVFMDLINTPLSNSYLSYEQLNEPEYYYPLKVFVCELCWLVQINEYKKSEDIFNSDYAYFSSFSSSWLKHAEKYSEMITEKLELDNNSKVIEIASNDGYLLQYFIQKKIPCIGIEPTECTAREARKKGVETIEEFFSYDLACFLAGQDKKADLIIGNNVLAHVPGINDFVKGMKTLLKYSGIITMEFPHIQKLIRYNQFDTIYHEHYSYLSLHTVINIFKKQGLTVYEVEELPTHGGSLRIYARHAGDKDLPVSENVKKLIQQEIDCGILQLETYERFQQKADQLKDNFLDFLLTKRKKGKRVAAYGAAAKGNTLLNYCGIKNNLIEFVVDASPYKQGKYLPGSHIPIVNEQMITKLKPDYLVLLPWNLKDELLEQLHYIREWNGKMVVAVPELEII